MNVYEVRQDGAGLGQFPTFLEAYDFARPKAWAERDDPLKTPFEFVVISTGQVLDTLVIGSIFEN